MDSLWRLVMRMQHVKLSGMKIQLFEFASVRPQALIRFDDMDSHWAKEIVEELATLEIIQGYEDGTFRPNEPISRMHVAVLFARASS